MTNILNHDNVKPVVAVATEYIVDYHQTDRAVLNQLVTSSQIVAAYFDKNHRHVLDSIRQILAAENSAAKFFYTASFLNRGKRYPMYFMNRDGFSLLAMGFTGKKALEWKIRYIQAFNEMERKLKEQENLAAENCAAKFKTPDVAPPEVLAQARAKTMLMNARTRQAKLWKTLADESTGTYREICKVYAANILAGKEVLPLPKPPQKTMTATELGEAVGLTAMNVGLLANRYNLKTTAFGQWVYDVLKNGRQVESFRYYESAIPVIKELAEAEKKDRELKARVAKMSLAELVGDIIIFTK
nr:MAG TPA: regulatory protein [Caudoviricetes sp.]